MSIVAIVELVIAGVLLLFFLLRYLIPAIANDVRGKSPIVRPDTPYTATGLILIIFCGLCEAIYWGYFCYRCFQADHNGWGLFYALLCITSLIAIFLLVLRMRSGAIIALAHVAFVFSESLWHAVLNFVHVIKNFGLTTGLYYFMFLATIFISYIMGRYIYSGYNYLEHDSFSEASIGYDVSRRIPLMIIVIAALSLAFFITTLFLFK